MKKNLLKQARTISCIVLLSVLKNSGEAQTLFDKIREVPVLTPQAAAAAKYVEFPVNLYNGIPSISFPLYTIQSGDISIPIELSYHAGGIKVSEESSWVGLGFNLQVGGTITRQVNGKDDYREPSSNYFGIAFPGIDNPTSYNEYYTNLISQNVCVAYTKNGGAIKDTYPGQLLFNFAQTAEGEPDTYIYNFGGGYTGKFINTGVAVADIYDINRNNIKFNIQAGLKITAITPDGFRYEFADLERSYVGPYPSVTGYYLSKITSPTGKEVLFQYEFLSNIHQMTTWSEEYLAVSPAESPRGVTSPSDIPLTPTKFYPLANPVYLAKIIFDEGYVDFVRSTREDMYGKKLDRVEVHYKDGSLLKKFAFQQSYFVSPPTSVSTARHYLEQGLTPDPYVYPEDFLRKRLRLDALIETGNGSDPNENPKKHLFEYYDGSGYTLPYKSSWAADYWGFYNGKVQNVGFIPSTKGFNIMSSRTSITDYKGSYRETDPDLIKAGTLKKVTYPTKGWTEYTYSANQYTNTENTPVKSSYFAIASACDPVSDYLGTAGVQEKTFSFAGGSAVIKVNLFCDCAFNSVCMCQKEPYYPGANWTCGDRQTQGESNNILYAELRKFNPSTGLYEFMGFDFTWDFNDVVCDAKKHTAGDIEETVTLPAGKYKIIANYPDNKIGVLGQTMAQIEVGHIVEYRDPILYGGGLRVDKITHHDPEKNVDLSSTFDYTDGIMMKFPVFYWRQLVYFGTHRIDGQTGGATGEIYDPYNYDYLYSNSITPFSPSSNGNVIGYSKVTEKRQGGGIGKTEYMYENNADNFDVSGGYYSSYAPGVPSTPRIKNGFLKETIVYDNSDVPVKRVSSTPQVAAAETFWAFKGLVCKDGEGHSEFPNDPCITPLGMSFTYYFYPIQLGKVVPAETTEYDYSNGLTLATTTTYQYNSLTNKKSEQKILSNGRVSLSEYKYLMDYDTTSGWLQQMNKRNISSSPLEVFQKMDGKVVAGTFLKYKTVGTKTLPSEVYNVETSIPKVISSTVPYAVVPDELKLSGTVVHDANGNMSYSQAKDNTVTSYLWGYPNSVGRPMHAIAVVQNAMPDQFYHTSFEDLTTSFTTNAKTGAKAYNGATAFVVPLPVAGGTYKLTYWKNDGSGSGWQFVDDVMSANKAIGGSGTAIDEVRVFPVNAQMTTYTYDLLQGVTTVTDVNSNSTYFKYDSFGQLQLQRDKDYKIIKQYKYHYKEY